MSQELLGLSEVVNLGALYLVVETAEQLEENVLEDQFGRDLVNDQDETLPVPAVECPKSQDLVFHVQLYTIYDLQ